MINHHPVKCLDIKKGQLWELWLVSATQKMILWGLSHAPEELNQAQDQPFTSPWESTRYPQEVTVKHTRQ